MSAGEVARFVEANAGAGATPEAVSVLDARTAGLAAARTAALLINGVDPACAVLARLMDPLTCAAPAAIASVPDGGLGAEGMLVASEVLRPAAASEVVAPCKSMAVCGLSAPTTFAGPEAAADGAVSSPTVAWAAAGCAVAPDDPAGAMADVDPVLIGASMAAFAATADVSPAGSPAPGPPAAIGTGIGNPVAAPPAAAATAAPAVVAAGGGGGNGDGEDLPATGRLPPLGSTLVAVCNVGLRLGFAPASFKALAKSWFVGVDLPWNSPALREFDSRRRIIAAGKPGVLHSYR